MRARDVPDALDVHDLPRISLRKKFVEKREHAALVTNEHNLGQCRPLLHPDGSELDLAALLFRGRILANDGFQFLECELRLRVARSELISIVHRDEVNRVKVRFTNRCLSARRMRDQESESAKYQCGRDDRKTRD